MILLCIGGHLNSVKDLVSITDTSIAPDNTICHPIFRAASMGHLDIVKYFFATLSTPVLFPGGRTQIAETIKIARIVGYGEVVKFLEEHCQVTF